MESKKISKQIVDCFKSGNFVYACGNGGSAAMSQHFCAEFMGKFEKIRQPLPAISLTTDTSFLTAWGNDFEYRDVFVRQLMALGKKGDILVAFSTSGKSENVLNAIIEAKYKKMTVIDFPRKGTSTAKIQEFQLKLMHDICRLVEKEFI